MFIGLIYVFLLLPILTMMLLGYASYALRILELGLYSICLCKFDMSPPT